MTTGILYAIGGLAVLAVASDQFVTGAVRLAVVMRIAPVIVGSVIVGFGTSAPEMVVSGIAAVDGNLDIGVGNVVGSNVANISLVLGCATLIAAVPVQPAILRREVPISVGSVVVFALLLQGQITRLEGTVLVLALVAALWFLLHTSPRYLADPPDSADPPTPETPQTSGVRGPLGTGGNGGPAAATGGNGGPAAATSGSQGEFAALPRGVGELVGGTAPSALIETFRTFVGLVLVAGSAWFVVAGAERIAVELNLTGGFIGFTLVAIGTSAPELFTAVAASRRGEIELLIGNLLGSNMFNSLGVGGVIALVGPGPVLDSGLAVGGSIMMVAVVVISAAMMFTDRRVSRAEGIVLLAMWAGCVLVLGATA
ncbi:MAG: calcium/sodium antiporter [Acidimicrobiaceae bacterium]|nr:calcium/sodium antiporter [Acidimicrobiia bacterium]MCY4495403.1 calcium/sodium antiporter [Acidimicrobiaceae bacterium]